MTAEAKAPTRAAHARSSARRAAHAALPAFMVGAAFAAAVALFWNGVGPHDAERYIAAALAWSESGPVLGDNHWSLRHPFVLPMAAAFRLLGPGEFAATIANMLYAAGLVGVTFCFARKFLGDGAGIAAAGLTALSAFFVALPMEVRILGPEIFFSALAAWLFVAGLQASEEKARRFSVLCGLSIGGAWLCREVALFLPLVFAAVAFTRLRRPVARLLWIGVGLCAVIAAELLFYWMAAGDPLYRYAIDFGHAGAESIADLVAPSEGLLAHAAKPFVNLLTYPVATPFVILGSLVWLSPGFRASFGAGARRDSFYVFGTGSALSFVFASYALDLNEPHYYPLVVYAATLSLGAYVAHLFRSGRRRLGVALFLAIVGLNAASADFRSYDEYAEARHLAAIARRSVESVSTDPVTAIRTRMYLRLAGATERDAAERVRTMTRGRPGCGLVYVATPRGSRPAIEPSPAWRLEERVKARKERWTHALLRTLGAGRWPSARLREILAGAEPAALYRAPACGGDQVE